MDTRCGFVLPWLVVGLAATACNKSAPRSTGAQASSVAHTAASGTTFTVKVPSKGSTLKYRERTSLRFSMSMAALGKTTKMSLKQDSEHDSTEKILSVNAEAPTKVEITYDKRTETDVGPKGKTTTKRSPVDGKSYVADLEGGKIAVTDPKGKKVSKAEAKIVKEDESDLGKADPFTQALPHHPLKKGEALHFSKEQVAQLLGTGDTKMSMDKVAFTFQGTKQDGAHREGLFGMKLQVTDHSEPGFALQMTMNGVVAIDTATGWPLSAHLTGPMLVLPAKTGGVKVRGRGTVVLNASYTYQ